MNKFFLANGLVGAVCVGCLLGGPGGLVVGCLVAVGSIAGYVLADVAGGMEELDRCFCDADDE